jgi:hypothetical protein
MNEGFSLKDLNETSELLEQLFHEVSTAEGTLSAGDKLGLGSEALMQFKETKVSFGNPYSDLTRLTPAKIKACGIEISPLHKEQMKDRYDFYYMTLSVSLQPGRGVQFGRLECRLDLGPKGLDEPIVHSIFPQSAWQEVLSLGRRMNLGLDGNLEWSAGLDNTATTLLTKLPASIKGKLSNKNELKAYITIPDYSYELGRAVIAATGEGNSQCFWRLDNPELKKAQTVQFGVVFKVPKGKPSLELNGIVSVEPYFRWLTANLKDIFDVLSDKIKSLLRLKEEERQCKYRLPIGDHESWEITLTGI